MFPLQPLQDKEGKKCLFLIKSSHKSFEISASDKKKKQEWIQGKKLTDINPLITLTDDHYVSLNVVSQWIFYS